MYTRSSVYNRPRTKLILEWLKTVPLCYSIRGLCWLAIKQGFYSDSTMPSDILHGMYGYLKWSDRPSNEPKPRYTPMKPIPVKVRIERKYGFRYWPGTIAKVRWLLNHRDKWHRIMDLAEMARAEGLYSTSTGYRDISFSLTNYIELAKNEEYLSQIKGVKTQYRRKKPL